MENFFKMRTAAFFLAAMCVGFTACSDDNEEPGWNDTPGVVNPSNVFTGEMPKSITFDYLTQTRATKVAVLLEYVEHNDR